MFLTTEQQSERYGSSLRAMSEIAVAYYYDGRLADALQLFTVGEQLLYFQEIQAADRIAFLLKDAELLIDNYFLTNQGEERMRAMVQRAREEAEVQDHEQGVATALYLAGKMLYYHCLHTGERNYPEAREQLQQAISRFEVINDGDGLCQSLFYLGLTYEREGEGEQARGYYQQAMDLACKQNHQWIISETARHLAAQNIGKDNDLSLHFALESLHVREEMNFKRAIPSALLLVSDVYIERGELDLALKYWQPVLQLAEEMDLRIYVLSGMLTLGTIQQRQNKLAEARDSFKKAAAVAQESGMAFGIAAAQRHLAELPSDHDMGS